MVLEQNPKGEGGGSYDEEKVAGQGQVGVRGRHLAGHDGNPGHQFDDFIDHLLKCVNV